MVALILHFCGMILKISLEISGMTIKKKEINDPKK